LLKEVVELRQTAGDPVIGPGERFTVTCAVTRHASGIVYVMIAMPVATPVTVPVAESTTAIEG
jgi:hypothetical protein